MKRIDYLILGLFTACNAVLTNQMTSCHFFNAYDKLLLTALWSGWLVCVVYYYLTITKNWKFNCSTNRGWMLGLGVALENNTYTKAVNILLPFMVLEFKWTSYGS
tara:strand:+ start:846 stop:1160 length:315 start_codon:yes stop_codon:yes gene_type:complete